MEATEPTPAAPASWRSDQKRLGRGVLGIVCLGLSVGYLVMALGMPAGDLGSPGPGLFPTGVGIGAVVISLIVIAEAFFKRSEGGQVHLPRGLELRQSLIFMGTLVAFIVVLPLAGMYVASTLYVAAFLKFAGRLGWTRSGLFGVLIGAGLTFVFSTALGIPLPKGIW
jgi:putative tricarboxylic transport membrane protein